MEIKQVNVKEIKAYAKNAKKHPAEQVKAIANSIKQFGFRQPLVLDKNNEIIVGHGRLAAAELLEMNSVPVVMADDLTEEQVKAFRLADNKTNESEWEEYIGQLCYILDRINYTSMFQLGFNNLDYQNYVPLYKERWNIDPDKYSTADMIRGWRNRLRECTPHVFCISSSSFQHACCRMGLMLSWEKSQAEFWSSMIVNANKKLTVASAYKALFDSKIFETPPLLLIPNTGEIRIHDAWR